jgi:hypothetical protein
MSLLRASLFEAINNNLENDTIYLFQDGIAPLLNSLDSYFPACIDNI